MAKVYHKLVRDRIPEIIRARGGVPTVRTLPAEEFARALAAKLVEEAQEVQAALGSHEELAKEIGDVREVLDAMIDHYALARDEITRRQDRRRQERGGFSQRFFLASVTDEERPRPAQPTVAGAA